MSKLVVTQEMLLDAVVTRNKKIIELCLDNGVIPDNVTMMKIADFIQTNYNYEKFPYKTGHICISKSSNAKFNKYLFKNFINTKDTQTVQKMLEYASRNNKPVLFKICVDYGAKPTQEMLEYASTKRQTIIFEMCLNANKTKYTCVLL